MATGEFENLNILHGYINISAQLKTLQPYTAPYDCFVRMENRVMSGGTRPYIQYSINETAFAHIGANSNQDSNVTEVVGLREGDKLKLSNSYPYESTGSFTAYIM